MPLEAIVYYLILIDAIAANISAWTGFGLSIFNTLGSLSKHIPITRGWTTLYLVLVIWLGCALARLDVILL